MLALTKLRTAGSPAMCQNSNLSSLWTMNMWRAVKKAQNQGILKKSFPIFRGRNKAQCHCGCSPQYLPDLETSQGQFLFNDFKSIAGHSSNPDFNGQQLEGPSVACRTKMAGTVTCSSGFYGDLLHRLRRRIKACPHPSGGGAGRCRAVPCYRISMDTNGP